MGCACAYFEGNLGGCPLNGVPQRQSHADVMLEFDLISHHYICFNDVVTVVFEDKMKGGEDEDLIDDLWRCIDQDAAKWNESNRQLIDNKIVLEEENVGQEHREGLNQYFSPELHERSVRFIGG